MDWGCVRNYAGGRNRSRRCTAEILMKLDGNQSEGEAVVSASAEESHLERWSPKFRPLLSADRLRCDQEIGLERKKDSTASNRVNHGRSDRISRGRPYKSRPITKPFGSHALLHESVGLGCVRKFAMAPPAKKGNHVIERRRSLSKGALVNWQCAPVKGIT